jgi:hypothetical protein
MLTSDLAVSPDAPAWMHDRFSRRPQNPFSIYAHLLRHLQGRQPLRLQDPYRLEAWIAFQQELLRREFGSTASFEELTEAAFFGLGLVTDHQTDATSVFALLERIIPVYAQSAKLALETRLEYSDGTSLVPLLLGPRDEITNAFLALVPVFSVGTYLVGDPDVVSAAAHLRFVRDACEVTMFGDAPCPWNTGRTRSCAVPRQDLCNSVEGFPTANKCGRKTALGSLIARRPDDDFAWIRDQPGDARATPATD